MDLKFTFEEIKQFALDFSVSKHTKEDEDKLKSILKGLGFQWKECHCKSLVGDLFNKLLSWLKRNKDGMLRFSIQRGILFRTLDNELVCFATLTNELAEKVRETMPTEFEKYIKEIIPLAEPNADEPKEEEQKEEPKEESKEEEQKEQPTLFEEQLEEKIAEVSTKKTTKDNKKKSVK